MASKWPRAKTPREVASEPGREDRPIYAGGSEKVIAEYGARNVRPCERLVRPTIGTDCNTTVGLHHHETSSEGKMGVQPTRIVDGAFSNDNPHPPRLPRKDGRSAV